MDLDSYSTGQHNCLTYPEDKSLREGVNTRQTDVRPAGSVNTAMQLTAVFFQLQSLQQFGGVSTPHLDWTMIPYVRKSFIKYFKDGLKYIDEKTEEEIDEIVNNIKYENIEITDDCYKKYKRVWEYAYDMTQKESHQAIEGLYHNLNTLQLKIKLAA